MLWPWKRHHNSEWREISSHRSRSPAPNNDDFICMNFKSFSVYTASNRTMQVASECAEYGLRLPLILSGEVAFLFAVEKLLSIIVESVKARFDLSHRAHCVYFPIPDDRRCMESLFDEIRNATRCHMVMPPKGKIARFCRRRENGK